MDDRELLRYSRHILLDQIGIEGQQRLLDSHVLVLGAGGLGSPVALYLASAGVGRITLVDDDVVDPTNLQRQIAHTEARIGQPKVESARQAMLALNPGVRVDAVQQRADTALLERLLPEVTLALDCSDNFVTRQALNQACVHHAKPLVSGAAIRGQAQFGVFDSRADARGQRGPCYACLYPPDMQTEALQCAVMGVLAPLVGVVGSLQALEAVKLIAGAGRSSSGRLLLIDAWDLELQTITVARNPHCPICGDA